MGEINESIAFQKPNGQHSVVELLWHMVTWKEFTISRFHEDNEKMLHYFEKNDWRELAHSDESLWKEGLDIFEQLHNELIVVIQQLKDEILSRTVPERTYNYWKLLYGILEHDIYHIGQIVYMKKVLESK